jgi:hypothetical protein
VIEADDNISRLPRDGGRLRDRTIRPSASLTISPSSIDVGDPNENKERGEKKLHATPP